MSKSNHIQYVKTNQTITICHLLTIDHSHLVDKLLSKLWSWI